MLRESISRRRVGIAKLKQATDGGGIALREAGQWAVNRILTSGASPKPAHIFFFARIKYTPRVLEGNSALGAEYEELHDQAP